MPERNNKTIRRLTLDQPAWYRIRLHGRLNQTWENHFNGMELSVTTVPDGPTITTLCGKVADQSALFGMLNTIRDLGLPLILVELLDQNQVACSSNG